MDRMYILWILVTLTLGQSDAETWHSSNYKSYYVSLGSQATDHSSARSACEARDSMLAVIASRQVSDFIAGLTTQGETYYIGLTGPDDCQPPASNACRRQWQWIDGTTNNYRDWAQGRPYPNRGCGVFKGAASTGAWDASDCGPNKARKYICQHDCQPDECHQIDCIDNGNYQCTCEPDYTGTHCDTRIDSCESSPCEQRGTCIDGINSYTCDCVPGYTGTHCETDIDECASSPCNNGTCDDQINAFECECFAGFNRTLCNYNIDECASNPCSNGGTCEDLINEYVCDCVEDNNVDENCLPISNGLITSGEVDDDDASGVWIAMYVGIALLVCSFTVMVFTIIYYRRFMAAHQRPLISDTPTKQEPGIEERGGITNQV